MNIKQLTNRIEQHVPDGWAFWAGGLKSEYNLKKDNQPKTVIMILPANYPVWWRDNKNKQRVDVEMYFTVNTGIKNKRTEDQQHLPYDGVDMRAAMESAITEFANSLTADDFMRVVQVQPMHFYPLPSNATANAEVQARVVITLELFCVDPTFDFGMYPVKLK